MWSVVVFPQHSLNIEVTRYWFFLELHSPEQLVGVCNTGRCALADNYRNRGFILLTWDCQENRKCLHVRITRSLVNISVWQNLCTFVHVAGNWVLGFEWPSRAVVLFTNDGVLQLAISLNRHWLCLKFLNKSILFNASLPVIWDTCSSKVDLRSYVYIPCYAQCVTLLLFIHFLLQTQLGEFDQLTTDIVSAAKFDASRGLEIKQTYEKLHLKEQQLKVCLLSDSSLLVQLPLKGAFCIEWIVLKQLSNALYAAPFNCLSQRDVYLAHLPSLTIFPKHTRLCFFYSCNKTLWVSL